jgi:hypothetical protein
MAPSGYPDLLSVQDPAAGDVTRLTAAEKAAADFRSVCALVAWDAGHGGCTWQFDGRFIWCAHGSLFKVIDPVALEEVA